MNLIEILVSFAILFCLLLGVTSMQMLALRETKAAYYFNVAMNQIDVLHARLNLLKNNEINSTVIAWNQQNQEVLPNGRGVVSGHFPLYDVAIFWGKHPQVMACNTNKMGLSGCYAVKVST